MATATRRVVLTLLLVAAFVQVFAAAASVASPAPMASMSMPMATTAPGPEPSAQLDPHLVAILRAAETPYVGTSWSVFNHRGSGFFIFLWGLTALIVGLQWPRRTWFRFVPPLSIVGLVEFLILRNDPVAWPLGPIGFWMSNRSPEVFQHRIFILLLAAIAIVELLRAADRLPPLLAKFALPALATLGALMISFHHHGGSAMQQAMEVTSGSMPAMGGAAMEASMAIIKHQHLWFAILGFGFAVSRLLADTGRLPGRLGATLWPLFAVALGVFMMGYTEG